MKRIKVRVLVFFATLSLLVVIGILFGAVIAGLLIANTIGIIAMLSGLHIWARNKIPKWAEEDKFFSSPKMGRGKARKRAGRIVGFIDNFVGKNKHANPVTGEVEPGEVTPDPNNSFEYFWWKYYGVRFIGLDEMHQYMIADSVTEKEDGTLEYTEKLASSIYLEGTYPITVLLFTSEGILLRVRLRIKTTTVNLSKALSLPVSWTKPLFDAVISTNRDHFGARSVHDLITAQNEGDKITIAGKDIENSGYVKLVLSLNDNRIGNISLADVCGQHLDAVNVVDVDFFKETDREIFLGPYKAAQEAKNIEEQAKANKVKKILESEGRKESAQNDADAKLIEGTTENKIISGLCQALGGDGQAAAKVLVATKRGPAPNMTTVVESDSQIKPGIVIK